MNSRVNDDVDDDEMELHLVALAACFMQGGTWRAAGPPR